MKKLFLILLVSCTTMLLSSCEKPEPIERNENLGVYYHIFVRSFADSNNDGIGDLQGIIQKLDYLEDLGIGGIWLSPIFESDSYHGYNVKDYYQINDQYGSLNDLKQLVDQSHERNIKLILDLPINHTSDTHEWFIEALNVDSRYHDFYTWINQSDPRYNQEDWILASNGLYYASMFSERSLPDLNYENEKVRQEVYKIADFYLKLGIDGYRLDGAIHIYGDGEHPAKVNPLTNNMFFWKEFSDHLKATNPDVYLVGEVWTPYTTAAAYYYGLESVLNFDANVLLTRASGSNNSNYTKILSRHYDAFSEKNPHFIDAPFLSNHDLDRFASIVNGDLNKLKFGAELLLTLPGNPFIYYGDELGMQGVRPPQGPVYDETRRLPMIWSNNGTDLDTTWFEDTFNDDLDSVSVQLNDTSSLLNHYKKLIQLRNSSLALHDGEFYRYTEIDKVQAFVRYFNEGSEKDAVLVLHNLTNDDVVLNSGNLNDLKVIYESTSNDYKNTSTIKSRQTIIFQIPDKLIKNYIDE